jgi:hypothetical protein
MTEAQGMKRRLAFALLSLSIALLATGCRDLFTTSMGSSFARDGISISSSASVADLVDLAKGDSAADPDLAKEILDVLSGKDPAAILALSTEDKKAILNLATSAAVDMGTITDIAKRAQDSSADTDGLVEDAFNSFDTGVNLGAVETLLSDPDTLATAPVDSLILATSVVAADIASELGAGGSSTVMDIMANPSTLATSGLTAEQQARMQTIIDASATIEARPDAGDVSIGDFQLIDFLKGTQP